MRGCPMPARALLALVVLAAVVCVGCQKQADQEAAGPTRTPAAVAARTVPPADEAGAAMSPAAPESESAAAAAPAPAPAPKTWPVAEMPKQGATVTLGAKGEPTTCRITAIDKAYFDRLGVPVYPNAVGCVPEKDAREEDVGMLTTDPPDKVKAYYMSQNPNFQPLNLGDLFGGMMGALAEGMGQAMGGMVEGMEGMAKGMAGAIAGESPPAKHPEAGKASEDVAAGMKDAFADMGAKARIEMTQGLESAGMPELLIDEARNLTLFILPDWDSGYTLIGATVADEMMGDMFGAESTAPGGAAPGPASRQ